MKKIRIISYQNAHNFGAVLQAYGLQQTIKSLGYEDVKFINYNPKYLSDRYNPFLKKFFTLGRTIRGSLFKYVNYPFFLVSCLKRNHKFRMSIKTLLDQTANVIIDENGLKNEEADILICGSDQIWNTALTKSFDRVFFGKGPYKYLGYAASYAPSTELSSLSEEKAKLLCDQLDGLKYLSVREKPVWELLHKYTSRDIQVCLDPTLLSGVSTFDRIASPRIEKKEYIVVYSYYPDDPIVQELIKTIPNSKEYVVHYVLLGEKGIMSFYKNKYHSAISVQDFLSYIKYAKYVVTNSFHGLAFSLLFEKNFNVAYCEGLEVRCLSLLQQIGLDNKLIRHGHDAEWEHPNYNLIQERIGELRKESLDYLKRVLEDEG